MEIIYKGNKHNEPKPEPEFSCECSNCGSAFIFKSSDVCRPRGVIHIPLMSANETKEYEKRYYTITCPVCGVMITLDKCNLLRNDSDKEKFKLFHTPVETENN